MPNGGYGGILTNPRITIRHWTERWDTVSADRAGQPKLESAPTQPVGIRSFSEYRPNNAVSLAAMATTIATEKTSTLTIRILAAVRSPS